MYRPVCNLVTMNFSKVIPTSHLLLSRSCIPSSKYSNLLSNFFNRFPSYSSKAAKKTDVEEVMPRNSLKDVYSATYQKDNGKIYDKKPFKMRCVPGKNYSWCLCGQSKSQPLCDGTHRNPYLKIKFRPVRFTVTEEKEYWLCNCKQTSNRPFCDGTHKREDIQAAVK